MKLRTFLGIAGLGLLTACGGPPEDTHPGTPVAHRQAAFKAILRVFEPMGVMLRDNQYKADAFLALAQQLQPLREEPFKYFGPDTNYPPTKANDKPWRDAAGFEQARQRFMDTTAALLPAAQSGDHNKVVAAYQAAQQSCKSCHDDFRRK